VCGKSHYSLFTAALSGFPRLLEWKVLDFSLKITGPGKSLKNRFGPGNFWKNILESHAFF